MINFFSGFSFFILLILSFLPAILLGNLGRDLRKYRIIVSVVFIILSMINYKKQLVLFIGYILYNLILINLYLKIRNKFGRNKLYYYISLTLAIIPLILGKLNIYGGIFGFVGLSYIFFRVGQIIIEIYDGVIKEIDTKSYLSFLIFFPSLSSGPIDRSRRYIEDDANIPSREEYNILLNSGINKLMIGILYKFVLSGIFSYSMKEIGNNFTGMLYYLLYAYAYGFYMFFDFAGYSLMAVGSGYILGISLPDNFNMPFISVDIKDFWNRWHITLSHWFRDFVFTRTYMNLARVKVFKDRLTNSSLAFIINMTLMGLWHGLSVDYLLYGFYHGILLALTEIYQKKSKFYKKYKNNKVYILFSWFITINLVMFGFLIFSGKLIKVFWR